MIEPGTLLQNRYRVVRQIGQGGMGAVYVATDERFQSTVAIKQTFFKDESLRKAFEREAHLLNRLRHAALPKVSDHFVEDEGQFLVMEYIEGHDLAELIKERQGAFPLPEVLQWADELLDALEYLHTQDPAVVHRDIKPQNLKRTPRGQIVLLDFGLAKGLPAQTRTGTAGASVFGYSPHYAPLEQMQGTGTDTRSDLYSLAATLYHLMTGVLPPDALTRAGATVKNQPDPLRPAHRAHAQVPEQVGKVLQRAMSQNAALRQPTARELRAALKQAAASAGPHVARRTPPPVAAGARAASHVSPHERTTPYEATVVEAEPAPVSPAGAAAAPGLPGATRLPRHASPHAEAPFSFVAAAAADRAPGSADSRTVTARRAYAPAPPPSRAPLSKMLAGAIVVLLLSCAAAGAYLLASPSPAPRANDDAQTGPRGGAAASTETSAPASSATQTTTAAESPSTPNSAAGASAATQASGDSAPRTDGAQAAPASDAASDAWAASPTAEKSGAEAGGGASAASSGAAERSSSSSGDSGLVIHNPAPATYPADDAARRAEEARRAQPRPEPGPHPGGGYRPPPPDGRRPPPPGQHPPPRFPPPRP